MLSVQTCGVPGKSAREGGDVNTTRAQLDAAEAWLLEEWRKRLSDQRHPGQIDFGERDRDAWLEARSELATAIRAIRAMRPNCIKCDERQQTLDSGQYCFACLARDRAVYAAWDAP